MTRLLVRMPETVQQPFHTGRHVESTAHHVSKVEEDPHRPSNLRPHCTGQHEVDSTSLHCTISGDCTDGEDSGDQDDVGNGEQEDSLQQASIANNVPHPEEEQGGEHGQGDWSKDTLDSAKSPHSLFIIIHKGILVRLRGPSQRPEEPPLPIDQLCHVRGGVSVA